MGPPPELVAGRYRLGAQIGAGGMGAVHRAVDTRLSREVAVKLLPASSLGDAAARERLVREALAAAALNHPGIIHVYDVGQTDDGGAYLVMELVVGASLRALRENDDWGERDRVAAIVDAARALGAAHRAGVVHRDVKLDNLMRRDDGRVVLLDFGIAKPLDEGLATALTGAGVIVGTPAYLSPEQARGLVLDGRTDQFSLAVTAFELLTRALPWTSSSVMAVVCSILTEPPPRLALRDAALADGVRPVLERAMAKSPADRYPDIDAFADALARAAGLSIPDQGSLPRAVAMGAPAAFTPEALARTELATPTSATRWRWSRSWMWLGALVAVSAAGLATWRVTRHPLDVAVPVVACPVLDGVEDGKAAAWLGAAAAYSLCDDLAPMLGGFDHHVRYPGTLLGMPAVSKSVGEIDPWAAAGVRERSVAAAKTAAPAWVDGRVEAHGDELTLTATVRGANGRELGRATARGERLERVVATVSRELRASGALGKPHPLDEEYRAFRGVASQAEVDALGDWAIEQTTVVRVQRDSLCGSSLPGAFPSAWRRARAEGCSGQPMDPSLPFEAIHIFSSGSHPPAALERAEKELGAAGSAEKRARLRLFQLGAEDDATAALVGAAAASARFAWKSVGHVAWTSELLVGVDGVAWAPDGFGWWLLLGRALDATDAVLASDMVARAFRLTGGGGMMPMVGTVYSRALLRRGRAAEARTAAARLAAQTNPVARDVAQVISAQVDASTGSLGKALEKLLRDVVTSREWFTEGKHDNLRITTLRHLARVLGRERAAGDAIARAIVTGESGVMVDATNHTSVANTAAVCALAETPLAMACLTKLAELPAEVRPSEAMKTIDVATRYVAGDFRGAAERARGLVALPWLVLRIGDFLADVFDRGGLPEMAEELDRSQVDDVELHGASLSTLRTARRAWQGGDKTRARVLAKRCVEAWKLVDVTVPAVVEMETLLASP